MKLVRLMEGLEHTLLQGTADKDVETLIYFSEEAAPGSMFFAIPGTEGHGLDFAASAARKGASVIVAEPVLLPRQNVPLEDFIPPETTVILVSDARKALAHAACIFYGNPAQNMLTVAVTGTKGKTSTCFMLHSILEKAGIRTGIIGTVKNGWEGNYQPADRTTPQSLDIQHWCRKMADHGCRAVIMEVSSQGLMQSRVDGILFDLGIFTNLSPDHIGPLEHGNFEEYAWWKSRLLTRCQTVVINEDDTCWRKMLPPESGPEVISFGMTQDADFACENIKLITAETGPGVEFRAKGRTFTLQLPGEFNVYNAAGAAAAAGKLGVSWDIIADALAEVRIPGRMEPVDTQGHTNVLVDYAHNGVSLRKALETLRQYEPKRLIAVFGCGGGRDKNRRFEMGKAAAELADLTVVTSDNPRRENPMDIIGDIVRAMKEAGAGEDSIRVIPGRAEAIRWAAAEGNKDDIILIAGKGHETCQIVGDKKIYFDDRETVRSAGFKKEANQIMGETET